MRRQKSSSALRAPSLPPLTKQRKHSGVHRTGAGTTDPLDLDQLVFKQAVKHPQVKAPCAPPPWRAKFKARELSVRAHAIGRGFCLFASMRLRRDRITSQHYRVLSRRRPQIP